MTANVGNSFERTSCLLSFFLKIAFIFLLASEFAICCSFYTIFSLLLAPAKSIESTMSGIPNLKDLVFRDTPFSNLMNKRIYNVLLIATKYDAFMLEDDGRVDEQIFNEYTSLSLRYPPRFTQVTTEEEALNELKNRNFELIICMPNMDNRDIFAAASEIKVHYPHIPIVVLTPFSKEVSKRIAHEDLSAIDYVFSWLGNSELLLAIIKLIEDKMNAPDDTASVGVQIILLVEDSVRFYSSALPHLYKFVL